ncbi:hypothetical protein FJU30_08905 [Affinibrenneria salicis]|uniref:DUF6966 domain-containing protein n=1 Tax=Affinibrenneria salicis TaxID=2590031 RepID=A0A5J5G344_9GAMM|nr:hypothetical protein [Affinibrenneria salicis]KAA9001325.1 hypothetical protein FJU30_08905 [Affinibrenneria salicis]
MKIAVTVRRKQLRALTEYLELLCELLRLDSQCGWTTHFEHSLSVANRLLETGFEQVELNELSLSIRSVYGGMGSFNDYVPLVDTPAYRAWRRQHADADRVTSKVYDAALALMTIGGQNA